MIGNFYRNYFLKVIVSFASWFIIVTECQSSMASQNLAVANTDFALSLLNSISTLNSGQNVFFSPASISIAMAMTYMGSNNQTKQQMAKVLSFNELEDADIHKGYQSFLSSLKETGGNYTLHLANKLFVEDNFQLLEDYLQNTSQYYDAEVTKVNFQSATEQARMDINTWVEEQTKKKIQNLLPAGSIDPLTRLVLVNAIYFKGNWAAQFDPKLTKRADFHLDNGSKTAVDMMFKKAKYNFGMSRDLGQATAIELPYVGEKISFFIILPAKPGGLKGLEAQLTSNHLMKVEETFKMRKVEVDVYMPRFRLEESCELKQHLVKMGMSDLFNQSACDLSGIESSKMLYVSEAFHKAFLEVNEEGSEAAAATAVVMMLRAMPMTARFRADHPFLFFIRDNVSKNILFLGKLMQPVNTTIKQSDEL